MTGPQPKTAKRHPVSCFATRPKNQHRSPAPAETAQPTLVPDAEAVAEPQEAESPGTPFRPPRMCPDTDPADDDAAHDTGPGLAVRLALAKQAPILHANRDTLESAAIRLKALRDRAS